MAASAILNVILICSLRLILVHSFVLSPVEFMDPNILFKIGFVLPIHSRSDSSTLKFKEACGSINPSFAVMGKFIRWIFDDLQNRPGLLAGYPVGYFIVDSCSDSAVAVSQLMPYLASKFNDTDAEPRKPLTFVVGPFDPAVSLKLAPMLQSFNVPLVDFGTTVSLMSDRILYPLYARTIPPDNYQAIAISDLVTDFFNRTCVHLVYSSEMYGQSGAEDLRKAFRKLGLCLSGDSEAPNEFSRTTNYGQFDRLVASITATEVVCWCQPGTLLGILTSFNKTTTSKKITVIASDPSGFLDLSQDFGVDIVRVNAAFGPKHRSFASYVVENLNSFTGTNTGSSNKQQDDPWIKEWLEGRYRCNFDGLPRCDVKKFGLQSSDVPLNLYLPQLAAAISSAIVDAAQSVISEVCPTNSNNGRENCYLEKASKALMDGNRVYERLKQNRTIVAKDYGSFTYGANMDGPALYDFYIYHQQSTKFIFSKFADWSTSGGIIQREDDLNNQAKAKMRTIRARSAEVIRTCESPRCGNVTFTMASNVTAMNQIRQCPIYEPPVRQSCTNNATTYSPHALNFEVSMNNRSNEVDGKVAAAIVGAVLGFLICCLVALLVFFTLRSKRKEKKYEQELQRLMTSGKTKRSKEYDFPLVPMNGKGELVTKELVYLQDSYFKDRPRKRSQTSQDNPSSPVPQNGYLGGGYLDFVTSGQKSRAREFVTSLGGGEIFASLVEECLLPNQMVSHGDTLLAQTNFSTIFSGTMKQWLGAKAIETPVVIKIPRSSDPRVSLGLLNEGLIMKEFDHRNVLGFLGFILLDKPHMVLPYVAKGNLRKYIEQNSSVLNDRLMQYSLDVCKGMEYLVTKRCVHRDLSARNVLVENEAAKISDFGLAEILPENQAAAGPIIHGLVPIRWHPPESLRKNGCFLLEASDVWSFGIFLWEIFSPGLLPYFDLRDEEVELFVLQGRRGLDRPLKMPVEFFENVVKPCWKQNLSERPTFAQIREILSSQIIQ